jgi:hypothetical protein
MRKFLDRSWLPVSFCAEKREVNNEEGLIVLDLHDGRILCLCTLWREMERNVERRVRERTKRKRKRGREREGKGKRKGRQEKGGANREGRSVKRFF